MTSKPILVIGATGKTGSRVASRLEQMGLLVRRGSRGAAIPFDWEKPDSWEPVLSGISSTYVTYFPDIAVPGAFQKIDDLCAMAKRAGVERLVMLSGRGEHHARLGEDVVRNSGIDFTLIRAAWFAQNFSEGYLRDPIIDIEDIADVAVAALTEDRHAGELYEVTGPSLMTFVEMADGLSNTIGRQIRHIPITFEAFHAGVAEVGGDAIADIFTAIARETLDGRNAKLADGVERAIGRKPRDFAAFATAAARAGAWSEAA